MREIYQTWTGLSRKEEISIGYDGLGIRKSIKSLRNNLIRISFYGKGIK